jgi:transposase
MGATSNGSPMKGATMKVGRLLERRPAKVAAIAIANKTARVIWAMLRSGDAYRAPKLAGAVPAAA